MQSSRSKGGEFIKAFAGVLPECYRAIGSGPRDPAQIRAFTRLVNVWKDRSLFPPPFCAQLLQNGKLSGSAPLSQSSSVAGRPTLPIYGSSQQAAAPGAAPEHPLTLLEAGITDAEHNSSAAAQAAAEPVQFLNRFVPNPLPNSLDCTRRKHCVADRWRSSWAAATR